MGLGIHSLLLSVVPVKAYSCWEERRCPLEALTDCHVFGTLALILKISHGGEICATLDCRGGCRKAEADRILFLFFPFERRSYCIAQVVLEFIIVLPQPSQCWVTGTST